MRLLKTILAIAMLLPVTVAAQVQISTDFDSGCAGRIVSCSTSELECFGSDSASICSIEIMSRADPSNPVDPEVIPSSRWFHLRLEGVRNKMVFLRIPNTEMRRPFFSYDGENYIRFESRENRIPNTVHTLFEQDTVYVAYFIPYTHRQQLEDIRRWSSHPCVTNEVIGYSSEGREINMLTVTDPSVSNTDKRKVWIHTRVHTSEAPASWHLKSMVDELLDDSPLSAEIRRRAIFYIVPETNPDGVSGGYSRSTSTGINLEINWARPDSLTAPEVTVLKRTIERLTADRPMDVALNMHSQTTPQVTYWIHTAETTSPSFFRREMLMSALTACHSPYYNVGEYSLSRLSPKYAEGWFWNKFGDKTLALTFETTYSHYHRNPDSEWVTLENLAQLAHSSLLTLSDLLNLGGSERMAADAESAKLRGKWHTRNDAKLFFGDSYIEAGESKASAVFRFANAEAGTYDVYKWIPGPQTKAATDSDNSWVHTGSVVQKRRGRLTWRYTATEKGEVLDAVLLVRKH